MKTFPEINEIIEDTTKKKSTHPNGIKEYVNDLLLGKFLFSKRNKRSSLKFIRAKKKKKDPVLMLKWLDVEETNDPARTKKFKDLLSVTNIDLGEEKKKTKKRIKNDAIFLTLILWVVALKSLSWNGIPTELRMITWQLLLGHLPCNSVRRETTLARKRRDYLDSISATYSRGMIGLDQTLWHQIHIDIPRTNPSIALYQSKVTQSVSI